MAFVLGDRSRAELVGVHHRLVEMVEIAITLCPVDFGVHDGMRTEAQQREMVNTGASQTMDSRHLTGHAVDLVPYINGKFRWEWGPIYRIADAMRSAARELNTPLVWGGAWDVDLAAMGGTTEDVAARYVMRRRARGLKAFTDGPHFELPRKHFPSP